MSVRRLRHVTEVLGELFSDEVTRVARSRGESADLELGERRRAHNVRVALERLGPFYVKLGQMLSTRPDIVPLSMIGELEKLHDHVSPAPFSTFEPVLEAELGPGWKEQFRHVDIFEPLGTASLAQVYAVTMRDGRQGVVKVQRPGIRSQVLDDMRMMGRAARLVGRCAPRLNAVVDLDAMLGVLFDAMRPELDFTIEAANMAAAREAIADFRTLSVPEVLLATPRVMVQALAPGQSIRQASRDEFTERERMAIGEDLLAFTYRGFFINRMFHADPHPGNIFVQPGGQASLIDWGMVGRLDRRTSMRIMLVLLNLAENDGHGLAKAWVELGYATPWANVDAFAADMAALTPKIAAASLEELNFGVTLTTVLQQSTKRGIKTNPMISVLGKAFGNIEGSVRCLAPELSITSVFEQQMARIMIDLAGEFFSTTHVAKTTMELMLGADTALEQARAITRDLSNREFRINLAEGGHRSRERSPLLSRAMLAAGAAALWRYHQNRKE